MTTKQAIAAAARATDWMGGSAVGADVTLRSFGAWIGGRTVRRVGAGQAGLLGAIVGTVLLAGCAASGGEQAETYGAQIGIVNHTSSYIYSASVDGGGGGTSFPFHAGIANICCVTLPRIWRPGLEFVVRWDVPEGSKHNVREKVVTVERYDETGSLYVHFFEDNEIRIVVTEWYPGSRNHPIQVPPQDPYKWIR